jgi:hypothetical protein
MRVLNILPVALAATVLAGNVALATDLDAAPDVAAGGYYGNVHGGVFGGFSDIDGDSIRIPGITLGAKIAHDFENSPWGWQVDGDYSYVDAAWVSPSIDDVDGHLSTTDSAAHLTYRPTTTTKFGLYGGYGTITLGVEDSSGGTFDLFDDTGLTEASVTLGIAGVGVEGLMEFNDSSWVQGRAGLVDMVYLSATVSDGVTTTSGSDTDFLGDDIGAAASASIHHRFGYNIVARAEASYMALSVASDADINLLGLAVGANYVFDSMPLSLGVTGSYNRLSVDGASGDGYAASTKLTYSFGGPSSGSTGKLFRSGAVGLTPN